MNFLAHLLFWLLAINAEAISAKEPYWEEYHIELSGLRDEQLLVLESTINQLRTLEPGEWRINKKVYHRLSRFQDLFGVSFNGKNLSHWLLSRIRKIAYHNTWTAAANQNGGEFILGDEFFTRLSMLERLYLLIHEARHSDDQGYPHVKCPKGFKFISAGQPEMDLEHALACDNTEKGAYAYQAAFLFELLAYGIFDQREVGLLYNSSISRVLP
jgi:hypothetical protein